VTIGRSGNRLWPFRRQKGRAKASGFLDGPIATLRHRRAWGTLFLIPGEIGFLFEAKTPFRKQKGNDFGLTKSGIGKDLYLVGLFPVPVPVPVPVPDLAYV
jgi:hypothetical protein